MPANKTHLILRHLAPWLVGAVLGVGVMLTWLVSSDKRSAPVDPQMKALPRQPCDVDWNGDCDALDYDRGAAAQGTCLGDVGYRRFADADRDGCVTTEDVRRLFPFGRP